MTRYARLLTFATTMVVVVAGSFVAGMRSGASSSGSSGSSGSTGTTSTTGDQTQPFYLVIGASSSIGTQPTGIPSRNARRTQDGYANDVVALEQKDNVNLQLNQIGCPGETAESMLNTKVADHCYTLPATQLTVALNFLKANQSRAGLVTIDLGFNDIRPCLGGMTINETCVSQGISYVQNDLPKVLTQLKAAAGPQVQFVGFNYEDPFIAHFLEGPMSVANAQESLIDMTRMNQTLDEVYTHAGIPVANIAGAFQLQNASRMTIPNVGSIPVNVFEECLYTWMCQPKPFGPDDHPNNAGYMVIAESIVKVLAGSWRIAAVK